MPLTTETRDVFAAVRSSWQQGRRAALATIVAVRGSAYRRPGAKMMMDSAGKMVGTVSGGCLEGDLFQWAEQVMASGVPRMVTYNLAEDTMWSLGIGCKGALDVLVMPVEPSDAFWQQTLGYVESEAPFALVFDWSGTMRAGMGAGGERWGGALPAEIERVVPRVLERGLRTEVVDGGDRRYVVDPVRPAESLVVCGAGHDAVPVVNLAHKTGFAVTVLDSRPLFNRPQCFSVPVTHWVKRPHEITGGVKPGQYWLVMNHHQALDEASLALALPSGPRWVGVLGPLERTRDMLARIGRNLQDGPVFAPVGLDLGAETPDEVAVSIVSQLMVARSGRSAGLLSGRAKIHGANV